MGRTSRSFLSVLAVLALVSGCYHGARATRDVNRAWQGRSRAELEARWGKPAAVGQNGPVTVLTWSYGWRHVELPSVAASLKAEPGEIDAYAEVRPGTVWKGTTEVIAEADAHGTILRISGPSLRWGGPRGANLRWGTLLGLHVGMGRLDDTATPLPSGGAYIGGMLSSTLGLVGCFSLVAGADDAGGAMGFAWGLAAQWWPEARTSLRLGPALVLAFDPGFDDPTLQPGVVGAASYAWVRAGAFVLDLRLDLTAGTSVTFGTVGVGVNLN